MNLRGLTQHRFISQSCLSLQIGRKAGSISHRYSGPDASIRLHCPLRLLCWILEARVANEGKEEVWGTARVLWAKTGAYMTSAHSLPDKLSDTVAPTIREAKKCHVTVDPG